MKTTNLGAADALPSIEWSKVTTQLAELLTHTDPHSPNRPTFWLTTLNTDGSPHVTSVGALWHAGSCWFQTGECTRKAKNIARDPRCTISTATQGFDVTVSGNVRRATDPKVVAEIAALWAKNGWPAQPDDSGTALPHRSTPQLSDHRRGSSTKSNHAPRPQLVPPKRHRVQCVGGSEASKDRQPPREMAKTTSLAGFASRVVCQLEPS